jgi:arsenate reductase
MRFFSDLMHKLLFVCIHTRHGAKWQKLSLKNMAATISRLKKSRARVGQLNDNVVEVMMQQGIDISKKGTQSIFDLFSKGKLYNAVITVCDRASADSCPSFLAKLKG